MFQYVIRLGPTSACTLIAMLLSGGGCVDSPGRTGSSAIQATDTLQVRLVLGSLDGRGGSDFGRISGLAADADGSIFVADAQAHSVRVFSATGTPLYSIGREGSGPEDLRSPCCITFDSAGNLWIRDRGNARYSSYSVGLDGAKLRSTIRMAHGDPQRVSPITFHGSLLADIGTVTATSGERSTVRHWLNDAGGVERADSFPVLPPEELGGASVVRFEGGVRFLLFPPFGPTDLLEFGPEGLHVEGVSSNYSLAIVGPTDTVSVNGPEVAGPPLTDEEIHRADRRLTQLARRIGGSPSELPFGMPGRKPPLQDAYFDRSGRLWVELSVAPDSLRRADVWRIDEGRSGRRVAWPGDVILSATSWIGAEKVIGVRRDDLGVEYVVVMSRP